MAKITVRFQNENVSEHILKPGFNGLGRLGSNSVRIDNPGISRQHAFILGDVDAKIFVIEDLASMNGIYVNKRRVQKHLLRPGDVITLGQHSLEFSSEADSTPVSDKTPIPTGMPYLEDIASGKHFPLGKEVTFFGNSSSDDIHIPGVMVGKNFASVNRMGTSWVINLLVKRFSQLQLNGENTHSSKLANGDRIEVAGVTFVFRLP